MPSLLDRFKSGNALTDSASTSTPADNALYAAIMKGGYRPRQSLSVMDTYKPPVPAYAAEEPGLAGGVPTESVTGLELSPLDLVGTGVLAKATALAKAFGVPLAAALGATAIGSRASQGAKLSGLAEALPSQRGIFAGVGAKTANLEALARAKEMQNAGIPDEEIYKKTGWFFGMPDKKPRFEIPDYQAKYIGAEKGGSDYANAVIEHPEFFKAYPGASGMKVEEVSGAGGSYLANPSGAYGRMEIGSEAQSPISVAAHELQHAVQQREGFARGGSPDVIAIDPTQYLSQSDIEYAKSLPAYAKATDKESFLRNFAGMKLDHPELAYKRLAGESESRLTQARLAMTPEERAASYPPSMFDVPAEQQIVRYAEGRAMSAPEDYRGLHTAPTKDSGAPLHDLTGGGTVYPDDIYSPMAKQYYGTGESGDARLFQKIHSLKGKPNELVDVWRAVPKDVYEQIGNKINHGDWVTIDRNYAVQHGESALGGDYKLQRIRVPAKSLFTNGDSPYEFGLDRSVIDSPKSTAEQYAELLKSTDETLKGRK